MNASEFKAYFINTNNFFIMIDNLIMHSKNPKNFIYQEKNEHAYICRTLPENRKYACLNVFTEHFIVPVFFILIRIQFIRLYKRQYSTHVFHFDDLQVIKCPVSRKIKNRLRQVRTFYIFILFTT